MPKPQYIYLAASQNYLSPDEMFWINTANPGTWELEAAPNWLVLGCMVHGLIREAKTPGIWKLSPNGWDARTALLRGDRLSDCDQTLGAGEGRDLVGFAGMSWDARKTAGFGAWWRAAC